MANAPSTDKAETTDAPLKVKALPRSAITFNETRNNTWSAVIPRGTTKEMLVLSALWSVVCDQWHAFDRVNCILEDRSAYAELLVLDAGRGYANVILLSYHPLPALLVSEAGLPPGFEIFYAGPIENASRGYSVKRLCDGVIMTQGHSSRELALAALLDSATLR
ncbi:MULTISPECIES: hypothetical protein [unclassified Pseudomonas]|uniref:hypothetical protein n=1 Tax=unclassified Pseudomonas TaxID=196821 RepID=UPI00224B936C|nr:MULTISPECIES: hypothetical protein [unclassified Pseudomonas]MCX2816002.1 hypothetical protein [Pseudomonas sp. DCB_E]MCX9144475.1 hypothetical protein [Pseudomonas sp. DCB_Q]